MADSGKGMVRKMTDFGQTSFGLGKNAGMIEKERANTLAVRKE